MERFKKILVAIDGSHDDKAVIRQAALLSQLNQAQLCIVSVVEDEPYDLQEITASIEPVDVAEPAFKIIETLEPATGPDVRSAQLDDVQTPVAKPGISVKEYIVEMKTSHLEALVKSMAGDDVQVDCKVLYGPPHLEIIREVIRNGHDLVMITAKKQRDIGAALFGNTTMRLMRKCPCPVWAIKSTQLSSYHRILAAVDPAPHDEPRQALNLKIMALAASLARIEQSELNVVNAWTMHGEAALKSGRARVSQHQVDQWVAETRNAHRAWLLKLLQQCNLEGLAYQAYQLKGEAGKVIPEFVEKHETDLIVMGTVCRTGIAGFLIGNTAEKVLQQVDCSVLAVKPDGFVSPVKLDD